MVAMAALHGTRIRYSRLLVHLVDGDFAGGVEDGEKLFGRYSHGVVYLSQSTRVTGLVLEDSDQFKSFTVTTSRLS